jgi:hypothetical protein
MSKKLVQLIALIDSNHSAMPPERFLQLMGVRTVSPVITGAMWNIFCKERRIVTIEEAQALVKERRNKPGLSDNFGRVRSHFFDSGSFTLWTKAAKYAKAHPKTGRWGYYDTDEFWAYMDAYVEFIKAHPESIDHYANVDVIPNPDLSLRNQKYLENKGLAPVPVVHYTTDIKWLKKYISDGYDFIALGGLVGSSHKPECHQWIDACFNIVCSGARKLPSVKIHGFGLTTFEAMVRYPWYSVDSTTWQKAGVFGTIIVPYRQGNRFIFDKRPEKVSVTDVSRDRRKYRQHYDTMPRLKQQYIQEWLDMCGVEMGEADQFGNRIISGVRNYAPCRMIVNLRFYEEMLKVLPEWPWAYHPTTARNRRTLDIV